MAGIVWFSLCPLLFSRQLKSWPTYLKGFRIGGEKEAVVESYPSPPVHFCVEMTSKAAALKTKPGRGRSLPCDTSIHSARWKNADRTPFGERIPKATTVRKMNGRFWIHFWHPLLFNFANHNKYMLSSTQWNWMLLSSQLRSSIFMSTSTVFNGNDFGRVS